jgi:hypothetical protein
MLWRRGAWVFVCHDRSGVLKIRLAADENFTPLTQE